jgi:hypothetical protein
MISFVSLVRLFRLFVKSPPTPLYERGALLFSPPFAKGDMGDFLALTNPVIARNGVTKQSIEDGLFRQGRRSIWSIWSVWSIWSGERVCLVCLVYLVERGRSSPSVPSYEDPVLDLPLPSRERIEVRGSFCLFRSFVYFVLFVGSVIARSDSDEAISCENPLP